MAKYKYMLEFIGILQFNWTHMTYLELMFQKKLKKWLQVTLLKL